ncbi:ComEC family competence protein [Patescibacteria group bacterium]|nr:ComEC family competence protein [Patescibacteria group bacterium]
MTKSKVVLYFCLSFIGGIFLNSFLSVGSAFVAEATSAKEAALAKAGLAILGILFISVLWRYKNFVVIGFCILFLVFGIWRHQMVELGIRNNELRKLNDLDQKITLIGIVAKEPDTREKSQKLTIEIEKINYNENSSRYIKGRILATTNRYPEYQYGDKLKITGKLKTPQSFEDFNYKDYLKKDGIYSVMDFSKIELLERGKYTGATRVIYAKILEFKNKLGESIEQNLSPPQSSILGAMILGDKRKISEEWKNKLNIAGVRHITAISGLHVTILTSLLMTLLIGLGLWRQQAFYFAIILITFFILMTGLQPSAIRAGIMGGLFLLAQYFGRMSSASRMIFFAGAVMLAQNPLLLKLDVGFQLSFLAMLGIIYLLPIFQDWLKFIPWENPKSILAMTFSAYLFTLPILIYNFGYVSFIAPLGNILIVPLLCWIMIFGFIFGLAGMILPILGWVLSFPAWFLLTYLIKIVDWLSNFPWSSYTLEILWIWLPISYLILGLLTWRLQESRRLKFLD